MKSLHFSLKFPLGSSNSLILASLVRELFIGIRQFLLSHAPSSIRLFQQSSSFLKCILGRVGLTLIRKKLVTNDLLISLLILQLALSFSDLLMILLDRLLSILVGSIGMLKSSFQFNNIR